MKEGRIRETYGFVLKDLQSFITISYLIIVGIGMLFKFKKYTEFGINIFDYSDVFDFLIAPFSDIKIVLFSTLTIVFVFLLFKFDAIWKRKFPKFYSKMIFGWDKKSWFNMYRYVSITVMFILYLNFSATYYGKVTAKQIKKQSPITLKYADNQTIKGVWIGKTKDMVFLLQNKKVVAIPIQSFVKEYEVK